MSNEDAKKRNKNRKKEGMKERRSSLNQIIEIE